jgi:uncharacterized glyoxalase superfamily protein PhnB
MHLTSPVPVLRSFDEAKAKAFYLDFLGFQLDWEYRHADGMPLYCQVSRGDCVLHLSEHHGDCTPGAALRIRVDGLAALAAELIAKDDANARPGIEPMPWGTRDMQVTDPFGNRLVFFEPCRP